MVLVVFYFKCLRQKNGIRFYWQILYQREANYRLLFLKDKVQLKCKIKFEFLVDNAEGYRGVD